MPYKENRMRNSLRRVLIVGLIAVVASSSEAQQPDGVRVNNEDDAIVAIVDGERIRMRDLDQYARSQDPKKLFQLNQQLFDFRDQMLDQLVGERLLAQEAERLKTSIEQLLAEKLRIEPVTEASVTETFERMNSQQPPAQRVGLDVARPVITMYLEGRKRTEARARYIQERRAATSAKKQLSIRLEAPRVNVSGAATDPTKGAGAVEIVEFSDFECPYCKQLEPVLKAVLASFEGQVKFVWKDYPLPNHPNARGAAEAGRCAHDQGQFWKYRDVLFEHQQALSLPDLKRHANSAGLDTKAFDECLDGAKHRTAATSAYQLASGYGLTATPTVFINGRMIVGIAPLETYQRIIRQELEASTK
jgi:protein-disulfide isomerase